jgi:SAM-dependent methyltransferase
MPDAAATVREVLETPAVKRLLKAGRIVPTRFLPSGVVRPFPDTPEAADGFWELLEHERIAFPSYPYEWSTGMLHAAAGLTLEVASELLGYGYGLKDATPYNVLFRGPKPVFVDVLSFEKRDPLDPVWLPYAQFIRTFLLPLAASELLGIPLGTTLLTRREGLDPGEVYRWLSLCDRLRPPWLTLTSFPVWLAHGNTAQDRWLYQPHPVKDPGLARYTIEKLLGRLNKTVERLRPRPSKTSEWSEYAEANSYAPEAAAVKVSFLERSILQFRPWRVLDVGANTGRFSDIAASHGCSVVAIDSDPVVVDEIWRQAHAKGTAVLPLVVDITRPSPASGWRNRECSSFLSRCEGHFDAVLMLAFLHHLLVTERVPMSEAVDLAADLTTNLVVIEWVGKDDPMFQRLLRGRIRLYENVSEAAFRREAGRRFDLVSCQRLPGMDRVIYVFRKRA